MARLATQDNSVSPKRVAILGSTGSIGTNTIDVITHLHGRFIIHGLAAQSNHAILEQAQQLQPKHVVLTDVAAAERFPKSILPAGTQFSAGPEALAQLAADPEVDIVVCAVVGAAGLAGTLAAIQAGKTVALANKESLVVAGPLVTELCRKHNARLLPVDSEHSAIFQALGEAPASEVARVVLTGSGGPFRGKSRAELAEATVEEALKHPTWKMGPKITIDSATLMNKALEVIEARWLFDLPTEKIEVIIHPESIIHSFVEFVDGSVIAQLSPPDMRLPIQYALTWPQRFDSPTRRLDWATLRTLHFEAPDRNTFEALNLGYDVARRGGTSGAVLNAANEAAVTRFLEGRLSFLNIARVVRAILEQHNYSPRPTLDELLALDRWARQEAERWT